MKAFTHTLKWIFGAWAIVLCAMCAKAAVIDIDSRMCATDSSVYQQQKQANCTSLAQRLPSHFAMLKKPRRRKKRRRDKSYRMGISLGSPLFMNLRTEAVMMRYDEFLVMLTADLAYLPLAISKRDNIKPFHYGLGLKSYFLKELLFAGLSVGKSQFKWNGTLDDLGVLTEVSLPTSIFVVTPYLGIKYGKAAFVTAELGYAFMPKKINMEYEANGQQYDFSQKKPELFMPFAFSVGVGFAF